MNFYEQFLIKLKENNFDHRAPDLVAFTTENMQKIVHDIKYWEPEKEYKYMLTFTLDPSKVNLKDNDKKDKIEKYISNLIRGPDTIKAYMAREHNDSNTHWHVIVHRRKALKSDYLSYYKKTYGRVDTSRSKNLEDTHSMKYLTKESEIIQIV